MTTGLNDAVRTVVPSAVEQQVEQMSTLGSGVSGWRRRVRQSLRSARSLPLEPPWTGTDRRDLHKRPGEWW